MRSLRISVAALAVPLVLLASGCGDSSKDSAKGDGVGDAIDSKGPSNEGLSAEELSKKANDVKLEDFSNLHVEGTGKMYDMPLGVDLRFGSGEQAEGRVTLENKGIDLIAVDKTMYIKVQPGTVELLMELGKRAEAKTRATESPEDLKLGDEFTKMFTESAKLVEGKYLKIGGSEASKLGGDMLKGGTPSLDSLFGSDSDSDSDSDSKDEDPVTKGPVTEIKGVKVIPLISKDEDNSTFTMYVPANGQPYPVRVTGDDGSDGTVEFSLDLKYSKLPNGVAPKAPAAGDTIDLNELMKSFGSKMEGLFGADTPNV
ncbi:hypothetical protein [Embleya sp. NBC_00896]|uniref:hypothetical protein n=1 Tax=Embleya sp. NBC_00896 TaxID=2975961 RepID=UPI003869AD87|nr:hypothetical protein OG928_20145 [Embleya sp. NBC_00896]